MSIYNHLHHFQVSQTPSPQLSVAKLLCKVPLNKVPPTLAPAWRRSHLTSPPEVSQMNHNRNQLDTQKNSTQKNAVVFETVDGWTDYNWLLTVGFRFL